MSRWPLHIFLLLQVALRKVLQLIDSNLTDIQASDYINCAKAELGTDWCARTCNLATHVPTWTSLAHPLFRHVALTNRQRAINCQHVSTKMPNCVAARLPSAMAEGLFLAAPTVITQ